MGALRTDEIKGNVSFRAPCSHLFLNWFIQGESVLWDVSSRMARRPHEGVRCMKNCEEEFIEHITEDYIQWSEKTSFEVSWVGKKTVFYVVPWKYRQSFHLLTCWHSSSDIDSHKKKESNKEKSCVDIGQYYVQRKACVSMGKEKQEHPCLYSSRLAGTEDLDIQARIEKQVLEQKLPKHLSS